MIGGHEVRPGTADHFELPIGRLVTGTDMALPVRVVHGSEPGPTAWLNAAIHGDEVGGVEVITRVLRDLDPMTVRGTVLAVPVVNVWGFVGGDRFLPQASCGEISQHPTLNDLRAMRGRTNAFLE